MCNPAQCYSPLGAATAVASASATSVLRGAAVALSAGDSSSANGAITEYRWDVDPRPGDEIVTAAPQTSAFFNRHGANPVTLTVRDVMGQHATAVLTVNVHGRAPTVSGSRSTRTVRVGRYLSLVASARADHEQTLVRVGWDINRDDVIDYSGRSVRAVFPRFGLARARFIATDDAGQTSSVDVPVRVTRASRMRVDASATARSRALHVKIVHPPAARLTVSVTIGRNRGGRLTSPITRITAHTNARADVTRRLAIKLPRSVLTRLRRPGTAFRVSVSAPGFDIPTARSPQR